MDKDILKDSEKKKHPSKSNEKNKSKQRSKKRSNRNKKQNNNTNKNITEFKQPDNNTLINNNESNKKENKPKCNIISILIIFILILVLLTFAYKINYNKRYEEYQNNLKEDIKKHYNEYVKTNKETDIYILKDNKNPENMLIEYELQDRIRNIINNELTDFEKRILELKLKGLNYKEISELLNIPVKSVDNALQ